MAIIDTSNTIDSSIFLKAKLKDNMVGDNYYIENIQARRNRDWDYRFNRVDIEEELERQYYYTKDIPVYTPIEVVIKNNFQIHYTTGPTVNFCYFISFIYVMIIWAIILKNVRNLKNKKYLPVFLFFVIGIISIYIQKNYPQYLLLTYAETIICLCMYFTIENPDVHMIKKLEKANIKAEKANRAKSDFLSSMSHEIRTPLNAIIGFSEAIKKDETVEECHNDADDIIMAGQNLLEIINGILDKPSSVLLFNWISYSQKSYRQKDVPMTNIKVPEFIDSLPY